MNPAFISTIMAPNFEIEEITSSTRRSIPTPNQNISGAKGQIHTMLPNISTAIVTLSTCDAYLGFHKSALHIPPMELVGMESMKCVIKNGKWGQCLKGSNLLAQRAS